MVEFDVRLLLDSVPDAVIACDPRGRVVYANRSVERLLGWSMDQLVGESLETLIPVRLREAHAEGIARFLRSLEPTIQGRATILPALHRDGTEIEVELTLSRFQHDSDEDILIGSLRRPSGHFALERQILVTRYLQATTRAAAKFGSRLDLDQVLETVIDTLVNDFDAALARIWLYDEPTGTLLLRASGGLSRATTDSRRARIDLASATSKVADVARSRQPFHQNDVRGDSRYDQEWVQREGIVSLAAFPLLSSGQLRGVLMVFSRHSYPKEIIDVLSAFVAIVSSAINDVHAFSREQAARVEAEDQKQKLQTVLDTIAVGVLLAEGPEGHLTVVNPIAREILGAELESETLTAFFERCPLMGLDGQPIEPEDRPLWRSLQAGERTRRSCRFRRADGQDMVLDVTTAPYPGPSGGAVSTFRDVTDRYRLEAELADRATQIKALLDHLPVGVAYFDSDGVCRASNGPARRFVGRSRREITGATAAELFTRTPKLRDALLSCLNERTPHAQDAVPWVDGSVDDTIRYLDWRFEPLISGEPPKTLGALALIMDVTERTQADFALQRTAAAAEGAARRKTQFLSAVSHDLRTPVNALSLQAELLARLIEGRDDPDGELSQLASDIRQVATNLIELINDLLDLTRFDSGMIDIRPTNFALDPWLEATLASLESTAHAKGLTFAWRVDRPGRVIRADKVKLGRVLVNLVSNAVKFTEKGSVSIDAREAPEGGLILSVKDTGPGIPDDQRERIFDEFAQLRNPERDRTKGTGLGLAICRRLVEGFGGRLTVESRVGQGSTFTAWYPPDQISMDAQSDKASTESCSRPVVADVAPILLVEDDPNSRYTLARLLEHAGYRVEKASDGPQALRFLQRSAPSLVLLDLMMPGMGGGEVLRWIRHDTDLKNLKVVILTGDVLSERAAELQSLNADGFLAKPVDFDQLLTMVSRFVSPHG